MAFSLEAHLKLRDNMSQKARKATENIRKMSDQVEKSRSKFETFGKSMSKAGKVGSAAITAPLVGLATVAVATVSSFDDSMQKVRAISGATGEDFEKLRAQAIELGSTTAHSASQVADAQSYMALAGWDANQIMAASPGLLNLASAAQMDLASASDILTDQMAAFGMEADRAGEAADIFAKTQAVANTDVTQLGEALKYAGGAAANAGMDMAQTNAVLGALANQSIKGSTAGTTFVSMLNDMRKSAEDGMFAIGNMAVELYDAQGNMRDMGSVMADVEKATQGMTTAQRDAALGSVFGVEAMKGVNAMLTEGSDKYRELEGAIRDSAGYSAEAAGIMESGIGGALRNMRSAIEGFMIVLGDELKPYVEAAAAFIGSLAGRFGELDEGTRKTIVIVGALVAALMPVLVGVGAVVAIIPSLVAGFKALAVAKAALNVTLWASPITWVIAGIVALIAIVVLLYKNWDTVKEKAGQLWRAIEKMWLNIGEQTFGTWSKVKKVISESMDKAGTAVSNFFSPLLAFIDNVKGKWDSLTSAFSNFKMPTFSGAISAGIDFVTGKGKGHYHGIDNVPYDGYHIRAHKGERLLTREENKEYSEGSGGNGGSPISISGNTFHVRQESDIEAIADLLANKIWRGKEAGA